MLRTRLYKDDLVELAERAPAVSLAPYVRRYTAWLDRGQRLVRRRHVPGGTIPLVFNYEARVKLLRGDDWTEHLSFTAGLHDTVTISESAGPNLGVQIDFTAPGARLFYDRPLGELANRSVAAVDVAGPSMDRLASKLFDARTWDDRFEILDAEITSRIAAARPLGRAMDWSWQQLTRSDGAARVGDLVREIGWSERHFAATFRREFGLRPKALARVLRFARAIALLSERDTTSLTALAVESGYYDQSHFNRDFLRFAGVTPGALIDKRHVSAPGFEA